MSCSKPIITSLLDTDAYKLHMQQGVLHMQLNVSTSYEFINRNKEDHIGQYADEIRREVQAMESVSLQDCEYEYLKKLPYFKEDYLNFLRQYRFKSSQVEVSVVPASSPSSNSFGEDESDLVIRISGPWVETILWEVPLLAIISEIVQRSRFPQVTPDDAIQKLDEKLASFVAASEGQNVSEFRVCDFGTRRRFSKSVHEAIVLALSTDPCFKKHFVGTSNYDLARRYNLVAFGTQAHEWFQAFQQLAPSLRESQKCALETWLKEYPNHLGIALTDCITMNAFLKDFDLSLATAFSGLRHDSGDPIEWGEKAVAHYKSLGIDPKTKVLVFSDGLNLESALKLYHKFNDIIPVTFGIGTQLTCSIKNVKAMNIVIKMIRCQGSPVAKVSDAIGKICCDDPIYVEKLMNTFNIGLQ